MIKQLKKKLISMTMGFVMIVMLLIFTTLCIQTYLHNQEEVEESLKWTLSLNPSHKDHPSLPTIALIYNSYTQSYSVLGDDRMDLLDQDATYETIQQSAYDTPFSIHKYMLEKKKITNGYLVGIVETKILDDQLKHLILQCILAMVVILILFYIAIRKMSGWIVQPFQEAWEMQKRFVADASHELKTPLTVLLANSEILLEENKHEPLLLSIHHEAKRMQKLVLQLLELARFESLPQSKRQMVDLSSLCIQNVLEKEEIYYEKGIDLLYGIDEGILIEADPDEIQELIQILMDNAQKYTKPKETIEIYLKYEDRHFVYSIKNTGISLSKKDQDHIFDRFYRTEQARTGDGSFGLGLAIAKEMAKRNHLQLQVHSQEQAVTFYFDGKANRTVS